MGRSSTTRILHVQHDDRGTVTHIKCCVSSDNNSVFARLVLGWSPLERAVADEIDLYAAMAKRPRSGTLPGMA